MAWIKGSHRSHVSGTRRWIKSKLVQRKLERLAKRLAKKNGRLQKEQHEWRKKNHEEAAMNSI